MPSRPMTAEEKRDLRRQASPFALTRSELKERVDMLPLMVFMLSFVAVIVWLGLAWIIRAILDVDFGWDHPHGLKVFWTLVGLCLAYSLYLTFLHGGPGTELKRSILEDIENGIVMIEKYTITAAKIFQEQEHGGLMYFLRTEDERVYVYFDYESQDLGVAGDDPMASTFRPMRQLTIERAPKSKMVIDEQFTGQTLEVPEPEDLLAPPEKWPESGEFVRVPWAKLESKYSG